MEINYKNKKILAIDIETFSSVDLSKSGVYAYANSDDFEILLFAYAFDNEEIEIVDLANKEKLPSIILDALVNDEIIKTAFNANFERICISKFLGKKLTPRSWQCSAVQSAMLSLPPSLEGVGKVLNIDNKKLKEGKDLIKYFCMPCKESESNNFRKRNLPHHNLEKWELFKKYCINDVKAESDIRNKLQNHILSDEEMEIYIIDQEINDRGILVDSDLVNSAIICDEKYSEVLTKKAYELTGLSNPNSPTQIKKWLQEHGVSVGSLNKKSVQKLYNDNDDKLIQQVLKLRLLMSKTSTKKYQAINRSICSDGRVRGLLKFYGASRTGRWAGRLVQIQNLPQNHMKNLDLARELLKQRRFKEIEDTYDFIPDVLSQLIRTAFVPKENYEFIVADYSAIEARVLAWISDEKWRLKVFESHGKIYEASASNMFNVPIEEITKDSILRQKGKIAELALGYGGSQGALTTMGALEMGLEEKELLPLVKKYRETNPHITKFWWDVDNAAIKAVKYNCEVVLGKIKFSANKGILFITLPSGRKLSYINPRLQINKFNREGLVYDGMSSTKKWSVIDTYGPKLVENIVQGISRDLLAHGLVNLKKCKLDVVMHVHDEVVVEVPIGKSSVKEVCSKLIDSPKWAKGLPLNAEGFKCKFYCK